MTGFAKWTGDQQPGEGRNALEVPDDIEEISLKARIGALVRGHQTLPAMRKRGLRAGRPVRLEMPSFIDPVFAWAIEIGAWTIISRQVQIYAHDAAVKRLTGFTEVRPVKIGERCYIGAGAIILPGVTIGDDAVVGAGAVVRADVAAGAVVAGNPARQITTVEELRARHREHLRSTPRADHRVRDFSVDERDAAREQLVGHGRFYAP